MSYVLEHSKTCQSFREDSLSKEKALELYPLRKTSIEIAKEYTFFPRRLRSERSPDKKGIRTKWRSTYFTLRVITPDPHYANSYILSYLGEVATEKEAKEFTLSDLTLENRYTHYECENGRVVRGDPMAGM